ncbi:MAG: hypothetical protein O9284_09430 [Steroidobacteraceae bacterium]|jgi:hypothetical protein|nr:hypothetical protein [Steroidobacteraceae bacterium]
MATNLDEVFEFLKILEEKSYWPSATAQARRTACSKLFALLEPEQRTVEYARENLETLKRRFSNANKSVAGGTVDEYARRASLVLNEFDEWSTDRAAWERKLNAKPAPTKKEEKPRAEKKVAAANSSNGRTTTDEPGVTTAVFPLSGGRKVVVHFHGELPSMKEMKRVGYFLLPYAGDWDAEDMPAMPPMQGRLDMNG